MGRWDWGVEGEGMWIKDTDVDFGRFDTVCFD